MTWMPFGARDFEPESPSGMEMLVAWRPCGPGGPVGLEALRAWKPCGPVTTTHGLNYFFLVYQKVVSTLFLTFRFFAYVIFFENSHWRN